MKRTIITSDKVKKKIIKAVEKALKECAHQHKAHGLPYGGTGDIKYQPTEDMVKFANSQPFRVSIELEFQWENDKDPNRPIRMVCQPVIDLTEPE